MTPDDIPPTPHDGAHHSAVVALFAAQLSHLSDMLAAAPDPRWTVVRAAALEVADSYLRTYDIPDLLEDYAAADRSRARRNNAPLGGPHVVTTAALACAITGLPPTIAEIHALLTDPDMTGETRMLLGLPWSINGADDRGHNYRRQNLTASGIAGAWGRAAALIDPHPYLAHRGRTLAELDELASRVDPARMRELDDRMSTVLSRFPLAAWRLLPGEIASTWTGDIEIDTVATHLSPAIRAARPGEWYGSRVATDYAAANGGSFRGLHRVTGRDPITPEYEVTLATAAPDAGRGVALRLVAGLSLDLEGRAPAQALARITHALRDGGHPAGKVCVDSELSRYLSPASRSPIEALGFVISPSWHEPTEASGIGSARASGAPRVRTRARSHRPRAEPVATQLRRAPISPIANANLRRLTGFGKHALMLAVTCAALNIGALADHYRATAEP